jgi:hypothetical protein
MTSGSKILSVVAVVLVAGGLGWGFRGMVGPVRSAPPALPPVSHPPAPIPEASGLPAVPSPTAPALPPREAAPSLQPEPVQDTPEARVRAEILVAAGKMGDILGSARGFHDPKGERTAELMMAYGALMAQAGILEKHKELMQGEMGIAVFVAEFDGLMPEGMGLTAEQRARFSQAYLAQERVLDMFGIPRQEFRSLLNLRELNAGSPTTPEGQRLSMEAIQQLKQAQLALTHDLEGLMTPDQRAHVAASGLHLGWRSPAPPPGVPGSIPPESP